jgi:serine/threonine-protein phosphatase 4 regulatory subunit 1
MCTYDVTSPDQLPLNYFLFSLFFILFFVILHFSVMSSSLSIPIPPFHFDNDDDDNDPPFYTPPIIPDHLFFFADQPTLTSTHPPYPSSSVQLPLPILIPPSSPIPRSERDRSSDDPFPTANFSLDLALNDEGLSALEKIYIFTVSQNSFHRVFIVHAIPSFLDQVTPFEAKKYVLPLVATLAVDQGSFSSPRLIRVPYNPFKRSP